MRAALLAVAITLAAVPDVAQAGPYWQARGCDHGHRSSVAYEQIRALVRHTGPTVRKRRVQHWATCLATRAKAREAHERARGHWAWRHRYTQLWKIRFARLPSYERAWAFSTGACESGNNPAANTGNGFYGAFQFVLSTAWAAGFTVRPDLTGWHEQAVRAVWWKWETSDEQWPVCGD